MHHPSPSFLALLISALAFFSCQIPDGSPVLALELDGLGVGYDDSKAPLRLKTAVVCLQHSREKGENTAKALAAVDAVKTQDPSTRMIVFGETILGWYFDPTDPEGYQRGVAEPIPGPFTDQMSARAQTHQVYLVYGMTEVQGDQIYNSQVVHRPDGSILLVHRKVNFTPEDKKSGFSPGSLDQNSLAFVDGIKTGFLVCADLNSQSQSEQFARAGVKLTVASLASADGLYNWSYVNRRFNSWIVWANRTGQEGPWAYPGQIYVSDPGGTMRAGGVGPERIIWADVGVYP